MGRLRGLWPGEREESDEKCERRGLQSAEGTASTNNLISLIRTIGIRKGWWQARGGNLI